MTVRGEIAKPRRETGAQSPEDLRRTRAVRRRSEGRARRPWHDTGLLAFSNSHLLQTPCWHHAISITSLVAVQSNSHPGPNLPRQVTWLADASAHAASTRDL